MHDDIQWLIGILATALVAFSGMLFGAFRSLSNRMSSANGMIYKKIEDRDKDILDKIAVVKEKYVRRDDLDGHIQRLDLTVNELRREQKEQRDEQRAQHLQVLEAIATTAGKK